MFTGIVEETGEVVALERSAAGARLSVRVTLVHSDVKVGDSIAVNGCCLTVTEHHDGVLAFDLLSETLVRTNLGDLVPAAPVNIERALAATAGNKTQAAQILGITPKTLNAKLALYAKE